MGRVPALPEPGWSSTAASRSQLPQQRPSPVPVCLLELLPLPSVRMGKLRHGGSSDPDPGKFGGCTWGAWGCSVVRGGRRGGGCWGAEQEPRDPPTTARGFCAYGCPCWVHTCVHTRVGACTCVCASVHAFTGAVHAQGVHAHAAAEGVHTRVSCTPAAARVCWCTPCTHTDVPAQHTSGCRAGGGCTRIRASVRVHTRVPSWERIRVSAWLEA